MNNLINSHTKWKDSKENLNITSAKYINNQPVNPSDNNLGFISFTYETENGILRKVTPYPKQRPLKGYRKAYSIKNSNSGISVIDVFDKPGLSSKKIISDCSSCNTNNFIVNIINKDQNVDETKSYFDPSLNKNVCLSCDPVNNIIKSASTIIQPNYSYNTSQLLYRKNKTFNQNFSTKYLCGDCCEAGPNYKSAGHIKSKCTDAKVTNCTNINNFNSVSSSSRIARLKYDTGRRFKNSTSNQELGDKRLGIYPNCNQNTNLIFNKSIQIKPCYSKKHN